MINKRVVFTQNNNESNSSYDQTKDPGTGIAQKNLADKKIFTEGKEMAKKEIIKREITNQEKLDQLIKGSKKSLYKTKGIFPFDFFPDTLEIDSEQVHIITRIFFLLNVFIASRLKIFQMFLSIHHCYLQH